MAAVTTAPQVFTSGCFMLLKTGTELTWHCRGHERHGERTVGLGLARGPGKHPRARPAPPGEKGSARLEGQRQARGLTWKPKQMVGMALKTAVQVEGLRERSAHPSDQGTLHPPPSAPGWAQQWARSSAAPVSPRRDDACARSEVLPDPALPGPFTETQPPSREDLEKAKHGLKSKSLLGQCRKLV